MMFYFAAVDGSVACSFKSMIDCSADALGMCFTV